MNKGLLILLGCSLASCNVVPPLDCLVGVERPGCKRNADGEYGYLYRSPVTPNGKYDVPPMQFSSPPTNYPAQIYVPQVPPPQAPVRPLQTTCYRVGNTVNCSTI